MTGSTSGTGKVHVIWDFLVRRAWKTGDPASLARVLLHEPHHFYPGDLQLLGKLLERSKLIAKKRGPKSRPTETRINMAAEVYRAMSRRATHIKRLSAADRAAAISADALFHGLKVEQFERHLFDLATRIKAAAEFGKVSIKQLEQHLKRGPRRPAKR
jgi:hypothetical protein